MSSPLPLEPMSPIPAENSQDSIMVQVGTTDSEAYTPIVLDRIRSVHRRRSRRPMKMHPTCEKPAQAEDFLFRDILCEEALIANRSLSKTTGNGDRGKVPRCRLAREGQFTNERSQASLPSPGEGLCFPAYDVQRGRPRSSGGRAWCPVKPSLLPGMAGCSRIDLATGNESRAML